MRVLKLFPKEYKWIIKLGFSFQQLFLENDSLLNEQHCENQISAGSRLTLDSDLLPCAKIISRSNKNLKVLRENIGETHEDT